MYGWSGGCWIHYLGQSIAPLAVDSHLVGAVHLHAETMVDTGIGRIKGI
jgi:hypothetical protein